MSATRTSQSVQELRQLIAMLERSGIAERRPEAQALLLRSRALLRQRQRARWRVAGKLGTLLTVLVDGAMLAALPFLGIMLAAGPLAGRQLALAAAIPLWLAFRLRHQAHWLGEAARWAGYHMAWLYDWFAEAVSLRAAERLQARLAAREVMWGWRRHRRALPHRASLDDVAGFLAVEYGPQAEREFRRLAEALGHAREWSIRGGVARNRAAERLGALRWSALMAIYHQLAASGALWPDFPPAEREQGMPPWQATEHSAAPAGQAVAPLPPAPADTPERAARRADLRNMIRRKRQNITAAFGWHLKTEAEILQRDNFLAQIRAEIADMEAELARLGG